MNQTAVRDYILGALQSMDGLTGAQAGYPEPMPALTAEYPFAAVTVGDPVVEWIAGGTVQSTYPVGIIVYLGTPDMPHEDAEASKLPYADRFRALFSPDWTLGGNCFNCELGPASSNLETYRETEEYPMLAQRLDVTEHTAVSAAASG